VYVWWLGIYFNLLPVLKHVKFEEDYKMHINKMTNKDKEYKHMKTRTKIIKG
jgi:hypothetical protein